MPAGRTMFFAPKLFLAADGVVRVDSGGLTPARVGGMVKDTSSGSILGGIVAVGARIGEIVTECGKWRSWAGGRKVPFFSRRRPIKYI